MDFTRGSTHNIPTMTTRVSFAIIIYARCSYTATQRTGEQILIRHTTIRSEHPTHFERTEQKKKKQKTKQKQKQKNHTHTKRRFLPVFEFNGVNGFSQTMSVVEKTNPRRRVTRIAFYAQTRPYSGPHNIMMAREETDRNKNESVHNIHV